MSVQKPGANRCAATAVGLGLVVQLYIYSSTTGWPVYTVEPLEDGLTCPKLKYKVVVISTIFISVLLASQCTATREWHPAMWSNHFSWDSRSASDLFCLETRSSTHTCKYTTLGQLVVALPTMHADATRLLVSQKCSRFWYAQRICRDLFCS